VQSGVDVVVVSGQVFKAETLLSLCSSWLLLIVELFWLTDISAEELIELISAPYLHGGWTEVSVLYGKWCFGGFSSSSFLIELLKGVWIGTVMVSGFLMAGFRWAYLVLGRFVFLSPKLSRPQLTLLLLLRLLGLILLSSPPFGSSALLLLVLLLLLAKVLLKLLHLFLLLLLPLDPCSLPCLQSSPSGFGLMALCLNEGINSIGFGPLLECFRGAA